MCISQLRSSKTPETPPCLDDVRQIYASELHLARSYIPQLRAVGAYAYGTEVDYGNRRGDTERREDGHLPSGKVDALDQARCKRLAPGIGKTDVQVFVPTGRRDRNRLGLDLLFNDSQRLLPRDRARSDQPE